MIIINKRRVLCPTQPEGSPVRLCVCACRLSTLCVNEGEEEEAGDFVRVETTKTKTAEFTYSHKIRTL